MESANKLYNESYYVSSTSVKQYAHRTIYDDNVKRARDGIWRYNESNLYAYLEIGN